MTTWTQMSKTQRIAIIREGFAQNLSFGQMAEPYGCTRNAVIGFAHRNGLVSSHVRERAPVPPKVSPPKRQHAAHCRGLPTPAASVERQAQPVPRPSGPLVPPLALSASRRVPLMARTSLQCPWPDDDRGADGLATFCGHALEPGANWCARHRRLARRGG